MTVKKTYLKFHIRIFLLAGAFFTLLTCSFILFQYSREKQYKIELLNSKLEKRNDSIYQTVNYQVALDSIKIESKTSFRTTVLDLSGNVLFDSETKSGSIENHSNRPEIQKAIISGSGYDVRRKSKVTGKIYFYSAKRYENCIIRTATPYNSNLTVTLKVDKSFAWIAALLLLVLGVIFYKIMKRLGDSIDRLKEFAIKAESEEVVEYHADFPSNELGEISQNIIQIYNQLMKAKTDLIKEQQRVIAHNEEKEIIKRQLTQNIAHELKTPVSSIQGYLETIINNKDLSSAVTNDFIEKCYLQSTRLAALLQDISNLMRIDEAPEMIKKEQMIIDEIIRQVIDDVRLQLVEKEIEVINKIGDNQLPCRGNVSLLYSIFRNLLDNTIIYAGQGVTIIIELCQEDEQQYYFSYSDTGIGIQEQHLSRIFERFYRVDKGRSRKAGGTGLGLAVVKHAVMFHQGSIIAKPRKRGGIEFLFSISKA